ncbi:MAG: hypothetical protein O2855_09180, partial [Planctomycetota bacterium]|nr:hypothetical protein [Planctomycetota bacterium]
MSSAISWFFEHVESGVILEDDCVPSASFLPFCADLLDRFDGDPRVMSILGTRCAPPAPDDAPSYSFSRHFNVWGWASWRRAWQHYRLNITGWRGSPELASGRFAGLSPRSSSYWARRFDGVSSQSPPGTWDHQWSMAHLLQGGLCALPARNLVSNIGTDDAATHFARPSPWCCRTVGELTLPLKHAPSLDIDAASDHHYETWACNHRPWPLRKAWQFINRWQLG